MMTPEHLARVKYIAKRILQAGPFDRPTYQELAVETGSSTVCVGYDVRFLILAEIIDPPNIGVQALRGWFLRGKISRLEYERRVGKIFEEIEAQDIPPEEDTLLEYVLRSSQ